MTEEAKDDAEILEAVEQFAREMLREEPELEELIRRARSGTASVSDVVRETWRISAERPEFESELKDALCCAFGIEPAPTDLALFPERRKLLDRWGFEEDDLIYQPFDDRPDYKMLHPLLMGMIVELIQYDGDVPELRTGRLPEGGSPAVPVETSARDPVVIGSLLRTASTQVAKELAAAQERQDESVARTLELVGEGNDSDSVGLSLREETERAVGVPGYRPGQRAVPRRVEAPTTAELAKMGFEERQELAHKTLTSTQGRRSVAPVIAEMVLKTLHERGFPGIVLGNGSEAFAEAEWIVSMEGGRSERNPRFNFVDTAAQAIATKLGNTLDLSASGYTRWQLEVVPVNEIAERRVGWRAVLRK